MRTPIVWSFALCALLALSVACSTTPTGNVVVPVAPSEPALPPAVTAFVTEPAPLVDVPNTSNETQIIPTPQSSPPVFFNASPARTGPRKLWMKVTDNGYEPADFTVKAGRPIKLIVNGDEVTTCTQEIMSKDLNFSRMLGPGDNEIDIPALKPGVYTFSCGMRMVWGSITVE